MLLNFRLQVPVLVSLGFAITKYHSKAIWQQTFISCSPGGRGVQDQGDSRFHI